MVLWDSRFLQVEDDVILGKSHLSDFYLCVPLFIVHKEITYSCQCLGAMA